MVNIHAPTEEKEKVVKDEFDENLEIVTNNIPRSHVKIVLGRRHPRYEMKELQREDILRRCREDIRKRLEECAVERQEDEIERKDAEMETYLEDFLNEGATNDQQQMEEEAEKECRMDEDIYRRKQKYIN
ncbi:hypothetical protein ILUMI_24739 [Ignelater luminosus]|uniref:Uncharacterized protein n=1 Tax=Ignelater luminosus TaxID=2038154 RepID=A0A8K0C6L1_IGNLU|nr:hypothetical protein ILUMI_24739 [Ignelater luminosus]